MKQEEHKRRARAGSGGRSPPHPTLHNHKPNRHLKIPSPSSAASTAPFFLTPSSSLLTAPTTGTATRSAGGEKNIEAAEEASPVAQFFFFSPRPRFLAREHMARGRDSLHPLPPPHFYTISHHMAAPLLLRSLLPLDPPQTPPPPLLCVSSH